MAEMRQRQAVPAAAAGGAFLGPPAEIHPPSSAASSTSRKQRQRRWTTLFYPAIVLLTLCATYYYYLSAPSSSSRSTLNMNIGDRVTKIRPGSGESLPEGQVWGHGDFDDGRMRTAKGAFCEPRGEGMYWVNVMLGNGGPEPNLSGGMIPAVAPPFGMTRWSPQTRENYVSMCPYNQSDTKIHGFIGTHQPAIWMGESGPAQISAGLGDVVTDFERRGLSFKREDEYASGNYYRNVLDAGQNGSIEAELTATSRVGHMRYTFAPSAAGIEPHIVVTASRESWFLHGDQPDDKVRSYPNGFVRVDVGRQEISGWNDERQDSILLSEELPAKEFKGYFVARFSRPFKASGLSSRGVLKPKHQVGKGTVLAAWATFDEGTEVVEVRVGVSFISIEQARRNIDHEIPDGQSFEDTSRQTRTAWNDKLDLLAVSGATPQNLTVLYSSFAHTLVYPYEIHENTADPSTSDPSDPSATSWSYYSGYLDMVVPGTSYSGYSIWDTFRAQSAWLLLVAPERVGGMISSMIQDYEQGGWLPMWKNLVETNIMVGTHADSIIAQAMNAGNKDFDWEKAWKAVRKNAFTPPDRDTELRFGDREEGTPQEVRAGLTEYMKLGYVAADLHDESGSRSLDYAYDDHAASIVASHVGAQADAERLKDRSKNYRHLFNAATGHMEARNSDGSFAGDMVGWTEGDHWAYTLNVMHDVPGLIDLMGGRDAFVDFLDRHFEGGHNLHTNEPSHHIPYLYALAGAPHKTQARVRALGQSEYNHTASGLSGNEDCGQMSAWYLFSALGFYPVDPASATYVLGAPFFDNVTLRLPAHPSSSSSSSTSGTSGATLETLEIRANGSSNGLTYVGSLDINGQTWKENTITHRMIVDGGVWVWKMSGTEQVWP